ncbi:MAG: hypothetical protein KKE24_04570 [Candidatus Thermoplasmatota archaeon]|nr:hypothetical protein [Candidatus Thermoplasmatota archaeon]
MTKLEKMEKQNKSWILVSSAFVFVALAFSMLSVTGFKVENKILVYVYLIAAFIMGCLSLYLLYRVSKIQ